MEKLLTAKQVAEILNCHKQTVYRNSNLPYLKLPGVGKRYREPDLIKYLEQRSTLFYKNLENNPINPLPESAFPTILSSGGETSGMPKGKNKTRFNLGYGTIYQRKTKKGKIRWYLDYRDSDNNRIQTLAPLAVTKEEARAALREAVARAFDRKYNTKREKGNITFKEFADLYIDNYAKVNKQSWDSDQYRIQSNMLPFFGNLPLKEINPFLIEKYRAERLEKTRKTMNGTTHISKSTVNREITIMKRMFNVAIDWGHAETNPVQKVKLFSEKDTQKERILTDEEELNLLKACPKYIRPIVETALNTGMRRGEIFNLKWEQVDLDEMTITVLYTKSGKNRTIPINSRLHQILLEQEEKSIQSPLVFPNPDTRRPFVDIKKSFKSACDKANIKDLRFHDLRHTFASRLVRAGVDLITVRDLLGHFSVRVTQRYTHSSKDQKQQAVDLLSKTTLKSPQKGENLLHNGYIN